MKVNASTPSGVDALNSISDAPALGIGRVKGECWAAGRRSVDKDRRPFALLMRRVQLKMKP
jgi:hypothetical protein